MAVYIRLNGFEQPAAIFGFDSNVSAFDWSSVGILDNPLKNRRRGPCACSKKNQPNTTDSKRFDKHKLTLRPRWGTHKLELQFAQLNAPEHGPKRYNSVIAATPAILSRRKSVARIISDVYYLKRRTC
jgi:hypothetical protein